MYRQYFQTSALLLYVRHILVSTQLDIGRVTRTAVVLVPLFSGTTVLLERGAAFSENSKFSCEDWRAC